MSTPLSTRNIDERAAFQAAVADERPFNALLAWFGRGEQANDANEERHLAIAARWSDLLWEDFLVDAGITPAQGIGGQIRTKLGEALLPPLVRDDDARSWLDPLFDDAAIAAAIDQLEPSTIVEFAARAGLSDARLMRDLETAARILSLRIGAAGTGGAIADRCRNLGHDTSVFLELAPQVQRALESQQADRLEGVLPLLENYKEIVCALRADHRAAGTSLELTTETRRTLEQISRLEELLSVALDADPDNRALGLATLMRRVVLDHYAHVTLGQVVSDGADLVAFQITEQAAAKSGKYVGSGSYWKLLRAGLLGGVLVAVFGCLKLLLAKLSLPLGVEALVNGINYSICFLLIYALGATLATKQPALTAAALATVIDRASSRTDGLTRVADRIVTVWRNQFISLIGNVAAALPLAAAIALAFAHFGGQAMVDSDKAAYLIDANTPWRSLALYYAAIAGVFLFLSGLIQGAVANRVEFGQVRERIRRHPRLRFLGARRDWLADRITPHLGAIASNVSLGFLLGSAGAIGLIFGLPLDIRHVAFSSAHVGVAFTTGGSLALTSVVVIVLGVLLIGLVNFVLSFGLTLWISLKSRRVTFTQWRALGWILCRQFANRPLAWFLPVARSRPVCSSSTPCLECSE